MDDSLWKQFHTCNNEIIFEELGVHPSSKSVKSFTQNYIYLCGFYLLNSRKLLHMNIHGT